MLRSCTSRIVLALVAVVCAHAQVGTQVPAPKASLTVRTQIAFPSGKVKLLRKRMYLFPGVNGAERDPLKVNKDLLDRIRGAVLTSESCFYCSRSASPEYIAWLQLKDCETPYCREITADDVQKVPEFSTAYKEALVKYKNKPDIARQWLTPFLPAGLRDGYYLEKRRVVDQALGGVKPLGSVMTDPSQGQGTFIDIDLSSTQRPPGAKETVPPTQPFLVSNVVPLEIAGKFYTWICTVNLKAGANSMTLMAATGSLSGTFCEVVVHDPAKCGPGACKP